MPHHALVRAGKPLWRANAGCSHNVVLAKARTPARALALVAITPGRRLAKIRSSVLRAGSVPSHHAVWVLAFARTTPKAWRADGHRPLLPILLLYRCFARRSKRF